MDNRVEVIYVTDQKLIPDLTREVFHYLPANEFNECKCKREYVEVNENDRMYCHDWFYTKNGERCICCTMCLSCFCNPYGVCCYAHDDCPYKNCEVCAWLLTILMSPWIIAFTLLGIVSCCICYFDRMIDPCKRSYPKIYNCFVHSLQNDAKVPHKQLPCKRHPQRQLMEVN